jgi:hypothetical protein
MDRTALFWFSALIAAACVALDLWFVTARCSVSPPLYPSGIAIGAFSQILAVALPVAVARHYSSEPLRFQLRGVWLGMFLVVASVPVLLASVLYSDGIGKERSYRSIGYECHGPALTNHGI